MRTELVLMGKRIDMSARKRRRMLVVLIYAAIAALILATWFLDHWHKTGSWVLWAALFACYLFLGGARRESGLVKPFNNKHPKVHETAPPFLLLKLRTYAPLLGAENNDYLNDERELQQSGYAHFKAYQVLGIAAILILSLALFRMNLPQWFHWVPMSSDELYYGLMLIVVVLIVTLPQSILLWTEPDMEPEPEFAEER